MNCLYSVLPGKLEAIGLIGLKAMFYTIVIILIAATTITGKDV